KVDCEAGSMSASSSLGQVWAKVGKVYHEGKSSRIVAVKVDALTEAPTTIPVRVADGAEVEFSVYRVESVLAFRAALLEAEADARPAVVLTTLSDSQIGLDALGRLSGQKVYRIDRIETVLGFFG